MRSDYYIGTQQRVTDPFYINICSDCKASNWSLFRATKCLKCGSEKISSEPANKK